MSFGALAFLNPWLLSALLALPIIYWLLRAVPPRPAQVEFPPTRILVGLENEEKTAEKTPWWLTLLRSSQRHSSYLLWLSPFSIPRKWLAWWAKVRWWSS